jgi:Potential Queuosine, Q, salvage protein family
MTLRESGRRRFLQLIGGALATPGHLIGRPDRIGAPHFFEPYDGGPLQPNPMCWPNPIGSPVLDSLRPVIEQSRDVRTHIDKIVEVAGWMAYEELPLPEFALPFGIGAGDADEAIDFILVANSIDTAFTDFAHHEKFQVDFAGQHWSDSEAEFACLKRAMDAGVPILDGKFLSKITRDELHRIFTGNIQMPMLDEKLAVLHQVGAVLVEKYAARYHNFVHACSPRLYDNGNGLIERMVKEFPRFNDVSIYDGHEIKIYKLSQLGVWMLYSTLHKSGKFRLDDPEKMTAFADYIVPVALRLLGITSYSKELEHAINTYQLIPRDSRQEIEIRAHCLYATALLTEEINKLRALPVAAASLPASSISAPQVIIPQIDARLWTHYHTTTWPHHLTQTIMY